MRQRIIITENERDEILNLHKKYVTEQYSGTLSADQKQQQTEKAYTDFAKQFIINNKINLSDTPENILYDIETMFNQKDDEGNPTFNTNLIPYIKKEIENQSGGKISFANVKSKMNPQSAGSNVQTSINVSQDQMKAKIEFLQGKLNEKFKSGLVVDGKWGPNTASAVQKALASLTPAAGTPAAGTPAAGTPAAGTPAAGTTPTAGTPK